MINPESEKYDRSEDNFRFQLRELQLREQDLEGKRILDIGAGWGDFAKKVKEKKIPGEIINLEPIIRPQKEVPRGFVAGIAQELPFPADTFDLVISTGSIPRLFFNFKDEAVRKENTIWALEEALRVVKPGSKIRMGRTDWRIGEEQIEPLRIGYLRDELPQIVQEFCAQNKCEVISVTPTLIIEKKLE